MKCMRFHYGICFTILSAYFIKRACCAHFRIIMFTTLKVYVLIVVDLPLYRSCFVLPFYCSKCVCVCVCVAGTTGRLRRLLFLFVVCCSAWVDVVCFVVFFVRIFRLLCYSFGIGCMSYCSTCSIHNQSQFCVM